MIYTDRDRERGRDSYIEPDIKNARVMTFDGLKQTTTTKT